ncbi:MAG: bacillithiol system redox-active protein YtxJ [Flavobacteriales bacterium]|nr:bacillithiol system redox-active protein YtxJ [Flavobacteriales bacterium]
MQWIALESIDQLNEVDSRSAGTPILLFKHSTRCSISSAALARVERAWTPEDAAAHPAYYLDLLQFRALSNIIAERYGVEHASPQILVIRNGRCSYNESHFGIRYSDVKLALG